MKKRLHVAMIGQRGVPATFGGVERHVEEIGARLADRGHQVDVYCRPHYAAETEDAGPVYRGMNRVEVGSLNTTHLEAFSHSAIATKTAMKTAANVFHFHAIGPGMWAFAPRVLKRKAVVAQTIHGLDFDRDKWSTTSQAILKTVARLTSHVPHSTIAVSQALVHEYDERYKRAINYIPNGVVRPTKLPPGPALNRLGLKPHKYVLFVGRLVPEKAVAPLIEAFRKLPTDYHLAIVGGSSHTDEYVAELTASAKNDDRIHLTGYLYGDELVEVYSNAAAFVLPSLLEGLPLTLLEALAYDLPVVASDIPAHAEILDESGPARRMFSSGDWADLQEQLGAALANMPGEAHHAQDHARLLKEYDWDLVTDDVEAEYYRLLERQ